MPAIEYTSPRTGRVYEWRPEDDSTPTSEDMNWFVGVVDEQETSTGQSAESSAANAAVRGAMSLGPSAVQGAGALLPGEVGDDLRAVGKGMQEGVESTYPVNPKYEDTWVTKAPGAIGQGAAFLGGAMLAPASAVLGAAGLAGAASGADVADELGLEGVRRGVATLGYGAAEVASERLFGIGSPKFLKGAGRPVLEAAKAVGGEAVEEPIAGALQDAVRDVAVIGTGLPMVNPLDPAKRFEEAAYGAVGALTFGGAAGMQAQRLQGARLVAQVEGEYVELPADITEEGVAAMGLRPDQVRVVRPDPALEQAVANAPTEGVRQTLQEVMLASSPQEDVFNTPGDALSDLDSLVPEEPVADTIEEDVPPSSETANPATEGSALGGVSDPDTSVIGPATGSSAPAVSISNTEPAPTEVNQEVASTTSADLATSEVKATRNVDPAAFRQKMRAEVPAGGDVPTRAQQIKAKLDASTAEHYAAEDAAIANAEAELLEVQEKLRNTKSAAVEKRLGDRAQMLMKNIRLARAYQKNREGDDAKNQRHAEAIARIEAKVREQGKDPDIEVSPQSVATEDPSNAMSPAAVRMRVALRHRMAPGQVDVVNRPDLPANGWINKSTGKVVLNAPYLKSAHHIDETLYHEYVHRIEYDPDFQKDIKAAMSTFSKQDLDELDSLIAKARYDINEIPTERQAVALSRATIAFRQKPAFRRLVQRVKTWFKQQFGRPLDQRDAEAIASRIIAKSMTQARGGAPVVTRAGSANVRRSAPDARDAEYMAAVEAGDMATAQRMVDEAAKLLPYNHNTKDNTLTAFPKIAESFFREFYKETGKGVFSTGLYDQGELNYLVREEGITIDAGTRLRKESVGWLLSETSIDLNDLSEDSGLDFWGERWGMKAVELRNLIKSADPVTRDADGNVIPLSHRFNEQIDDIRYSRPLESEDASPAPGPTAQVFGREGTSPVARASFDTATPIIKEKFFDSDQPVSPEQTARVLELAYRYLGEASGPVLAAEVRAAVPSTDQHIANGILRAEMDAYGLKMLAAGDPTVYDLMQRYATTDFVIGLDEDGKPITYRRVAQELAGNSRHPTTAAATARDHVNVSKRKANAKVLGDEAFEAISRTVDTTKLSEEEVQAVGDTVLPSGETLRAKVDKATPKRTKKQRAKENPEVKAAQAKLDDATKAAKSERAKGESLLDQLAKSQSDTPSLRDSRVDEIRKVYYEALKKNYSDEALRAWLEGRLVPLEVPPNILTPLIETIVRERAIRVAIKTSEADILRRTEKLATGETGSLAGLERALSEAPAALQRSPAWRRRLILDYFMQGGLDKRSAGIAAKAYEKQFAERLVQATENAVKKLLKSKTPWAKKAAAAKGIRQRALSKEQEKLFKAVRLGLTDPTKLWDEELAKQNEWNGFTHKQHLRLQEIDAILKDPHLVPNQRASLIHEINGYITEAQQPPDIGRTILASYVASALGGFSTVGVQFSAHVGGVVGALTYMASNPTAVIDVSKMLAQSSRTAVDETAFAYTTGTYRTEILESLKGYEKPLEFLLKKGRENFKSENPTTRLKGVGQILVGAQEYTMKALNSIDQGFITSAKEMTAMLGTHDLLKRLGLRKEHLNQIIEEAMRAKADLYHSLVESGVPRSLANADATDIFMKNLYETVARRSEELDGFSMEDWADDIQRAAELEAEGRTGRISKGNAAHGEGMLQSAFAWPLKGISEGMGQSGALALYLRSIYGFMAIPFRTAMWYAGYSPYGFVRYGLHHAFEAAGKESPYRQSYGTRTQVRQRLREATAGTITMAMLAALASSTADDDEEKENALFVTGGGPGYNDTAYREAWLRRFKPYSIVLKINGSYHAFNYGRLGESLGWAATLAGSLDDVAISKKNKESRGGELDMIDSMAGNLMGNLAERSAFKGLFNVGSLILKSKEPGNTERASSQLAFASSAIVPWKSAMNTFQRMVADPVDNDTVRGSIISAIPVVGPLAGRPRLNVLGDPAGDMSKGGRAFALGLVSFGSPQGGKAYDLILKHGRGPSAYQRNDFSKKYETDDTDTKFYEFSRLRGQKIKSALETNHTRLVALDSEGFAEFLKRLSRQVNESTAKEMKLKQTTVE